MATILILSATVEGIDRKTYRVEVEESLDLPDETGDWRIRILKFPFEAHNIPDVRFVTGGTRMEALSTGLALIP